MNFYTREQYMKDSSTDGLAAHRKYYAQFVNDSIKHAVIYRIGLDRIVASKDRHMNDIPLREWDAMESLVRPSVQHVHKLMAYGGGVSLSDCVCTLKEAAKQIKEAYEASQAKGE